MAQPSFTENSAQRMEEIGKNLDAQYAANPNAAEFSDFNAFKQKYSYDQRSSSQQGALYNWYERNIAAKQRTTPIATNAKNNTATTNVVNNRVANTNNTVQSTNTVQPTNTTQQKTTNTVQQQGALKPLSQDYYNQSNAESQNTIVSNLNNYRLTNPEYFTDYDSFKRNFSYDARNDIQKQTLDTWYKGYQRGMELNSKAVSDIATQYKNGLVSDSDLEQLRTANQQKYGEVMNYINKQTILSKYDEESTPSASANPFQGIIDQYTANMLSASQSNATSEMFENYKNQMNSPEMTEMSDQLAKKEGEIKEYQMELNRIKSDVERRYEGTGASKSKINAIIADESYKIQELMNTANLEYNTLANQYNNRMTQYQNEFQLQLQEYEYNMKARSQQMDELGFVMDLMNFETNDQKAERERNQRVRQQDYVNGNINSKDEASRRRAIENAVDSVLTEFSGITMMRSRDQMVEDIKNLVDGGMSLGEAITKNIREPIMQKPEYKVWKSQQYGNTVSVGGSSFTIDSNGNLVLSGGTATPTQYNGPQYTAATQQQFNTAYTQLQSLGDGSWGGQCGSFVNNYLQDMGIGRLYTDPIEAKKSVVNSTTPTIGSVAVIDWTNNPNASEAQKKYGHVGIVVGIDGNKITLKQSNKNGNETIFTSTYDASQIYGYFDPRMSIDQANANFASQSQVQSQAQQYYNELEPYYNKHLNGKNITKEDWATIETTTSRQSFLKEASAYKQAQDSEMSEYAQDVIKMIEDLEGMSRIDYGNAIANVPYTEGKTYRKKIDQFLSNVALQKLIELKSGGATFGALSNQELSFIDNASTYLDTTLKYSDFMDGLKEFKAKLQKGVNTSTGQSTTTQQNVSTTQDWSQWQQSQVNNGITTQGNKYCYIYNGQQYCI